MEVQVSPDLYQTLLGRYGTEYPDAFLPDNWVDMSILADVGYILEDGGYYNYNLRPSQEGYFIPNNV